MAIRLSCMAGALAVVVASLSLQGCERGADSGATANPVAPGRPGTGNETIVVRPRAESPTESPQIGGARGRVPEGITGNTTSTELGRQAPGVGLDGGLGMNPSDVQSSPDGTNTSEMGAAAAPATSATEGEATRTR